MFLAENDVHEIAVVNAETYKIQQARFELYDKIAEAQAAIAGGGEWIDVQTASKNSRERLLSKINGSI
jgi:hypothetical protein